MYVNVKLARLQTAILVGYKQVSDFSLYDGSNLKTYLLMRW